MCCTKVIPASVRVLTGVGGAWKRSQEVWEYRVPGEGGGPVRPPLR